jgi:predicted GTPase
MEDYMSKRKVIIMGAAGRDFHNFNVFYRDNDEYEVVAFTATQIPNIEGRKYPAELAGSLYKKGIPIHAEEELPELIKKHEVHDVVFSYSDVSHQYVMDKSSLVMAQGANFKLLGTRETMLKSKVPVVAVVAVRTGAGKSQTSRRVGELIRESGKKLVIVRHPMPYGDLVKQKVQRFETEDDFVKHNCTIEEIEEYEHHINNDTIVYAGVDYEAILRQAEQEADVIIWDGGNNDMSFYKPDVTITITDPHRPGHELSYFPGEVNLRMADAVIINKVESAYPENVNIVRENIRKVNPKAMVIEAASPISVDDPSIIRGKRVLVVEDGPTLTHGDMTFGAGTIAARKFGALEIVDPRPYTVGSIKDTYKKYPKIGLLLPAMGYGDKQKKDLQDTINKTECDAVIVGTPIDLRKIIDIKKPNVRVRYDLSEIGRPDLKDALKPILK